MATIIEELLVTLNIDAEQFRQGSQQAQDDINRTRDAAHSAANDMASSGNTGSQFFSKMRNEAMMLMGLFTAGMGLQSFVKNTINSATQTGILADRIGLSTDRIKAFEAATERAGGSGQAMNAQLIKIADNAARIRKGESTLNVLGTDFARFGGDWQKMLDPESAIAEYARIYQNIITQGQAKGLTEAQAKGVAAQTLEGMGVSGDILPLLKQGNAEMQKQVGIQQQRVALSDKDAAAAIKAKQAWFDLTQQAEMFGQKVVLSLTPAMEKLTVIMAGVKLPNGAEITKTIEEWTAKTETGIAKANEYAKAIGGFSSIWEMVGSVNKKVMSLLLPDLEKVRLGFDLIRQYIPDPAELESIINRWNKKLEHFTDDFLTPANKEAGKFTKVLAEDWKKGFQGMLDLDIMSWTTKVSAFIDKIKELYSLVNEQVTETATKVEQSGTMDAIGKGVTTVAAWLGNEDAKQALATNEAYSGKVATTGTRGGSVADILRGGESGKEGYNAYNRGTGLGSIGHQDISSLTLGEIKRRQKLDRSDKNRLMAVGMYQMIPATLRGAQEHLGLSDDTVFSPEIQEQMFSKYLAGAKRKKIEDYIKGNSNDAQAMGVSAAAEWRSIADPRTGKTYADKGAIGNKASISADEWLTSTNKAREAYQQNIQRGMSEDEAYQKALHGLVGANAENVSFKPSSGSPVIVPKGEKDAMGRLRQPELPQSTFVSPAMQSMNGTQNNNITINVKSTDPKQVAHEIKTSLNEHLTTPFISNMVSQ